MITRIALALVIGLGSIAGTARAEPYAEDCSPLGPDLVTFYVDDLSYAAWYDGGVTVRIVRLTARSIRFTVDRPITGVIVQGSRSQSIVRSGDRLTIRGHLHRDTIRRLIVCYR
jgi:hypothetical protein